MSTSAFRQDAGPVVTLTTEPETVETINLADRPVGEVVAYLRSIAIDRPSFDPAESVTLTGRQVLAIADRLARGLR